jgi:hypothetical protein
MHRLFALPLLALLLLFPATSSASPSLQPAFTWGASAPTTVPQFNNMDARPFIVTNNATFFVMYSDGSGSTVHRWLCTSLDSCTVQATGGFDSSFTQPHGDDKYWLSGGILSGPVGSGTYYAVIHSEYHYHSTGASNFNWFRRLGLAKSTNLGLTWHYMGDILTSDMSDTIADFSGAPAFQAGPGDPSVFAAWSSGYLYVSYTTFWADVTTGARTEQTNIARCPLASIATTSCWHKWNNGAWASPGIGGHNTPLWMGEDNASISWDSYLNAFIAVGHSSSYVSFISTATSLDTQNWTAPQHFVDDSLLPGFYIWLVNTNADPFTLGSVFRVYDAANFYGGIPTTYITVTLT